MIRRLWVSDNGKYKVLVRHFKGDPSPMVGYWILKSNGKFGDVRFNDLPQYVLDQIEIMKSQVMFQAE